MNNLADFAVGYLLIYGLIVLFGGAIGYFKAKSKVSLISGVASGIVLLAAWALTQTNLALGLGVGLAASILLSVVFAKRAMKTRKFMPAGMMLLLAVGALVSCGLGLLNASS